MSSTPQMWVLLLTLPYVYGCDKVNCTDDVTKQYLLEEHHSRSNLAWLVTPALFALGVCYLVYKCCRDGLCNCRRLRERAAREQQEEHGYFPLNEVALLSSSQIPCIHPSVTSRSGAHPLVVIHNQTFCLALDPRRQHGRRSGAGLALVRPPPSYQEALLHGDRREIGQLISTDQPEVVTNPPSYISSKPPRYSVAMGEEESIHSSVGEDLDEPDVVVVTETLPTRQLKFISNRRRHRSAQDAHVKQERQRHFSAQDRRSSVQNDDDAMSRQRCFSFNALKDAFKRSQQNFVPSECESLLAQEENNTLFASGDGGLEPLVLSFGRNENINNSASSNLTYVTTSVVTTTTRVQRRPPQQVSFEDRLLESSESNENVDVCPVPVLTSLHPVVNQRLRQRHCSAPDTTQAKATRLRHSSGNS